MNTSNVNSSALTSNMLTNAMLAQNYGYFTATDNNYYQN